VRLPSLYGEYAANAQRNMRMAGGAPGVAPGVAEFQARKGLLDQFSAKAQQIQQHGSAALAKRSNPGVDALDEAAQQVIGSPRTPIAIDTTAVHRTSDRLASGPGVFSSQMSSPAQRPMTATEAMPRPTVNKPSRRPKTMNPGQQSLPFGN
jgi:hypothetical protein